MTQPTLAYARAQRDACIAYLDAGGEDLAGAFLGWADWSVEVRILEEAAR